MLKVWQTNINLQPVFHYFKAASYMCTYFSKFESQLSKVLLQAAKELINQGLDLKSGMYKLVSVFTKLWQVSFQGAAYFCLSRGVVVITIAQLYSIKSKLRFYALSNPARSVLGIRDGEDL